MQYMELLSRHKALTQLLLVTRQQVLALPEGYISEKKISGKPYYYLQKRTRGKMCSSYIKTEQLAKIRRALYFRSELEGKIQALSQEIEALEKAAALLDTDLFRSMVRSKRCLQMDALPVSVRKDSLLFSNAVLSLEGIAPTKDAWENLQAWSEGTKSFSEGYRSVLHKYNLSGGELL